MTFEAACGGSGDQRPGNRSSRALAMCLSSAAAESGRRVVAFVPVTVLAFVSPVSMRKRTVAQSHLITSTVRVRLERC
jgi:hypothetical protein